MFKYKKNLIHNTLIKEVSLLIGCQSYLELGVYDGTGLDLLYKEIDFVMGVDIVDVRINKKTNLFIGTTDDFFVKNTQMFDVIFIDADHSFNQVKNDFENSIKILNKYGIIFLHDTDPADKKYLVPGYCGDSYKIVDYIKDQNCYDIITLPILEAGLSIVKRKSDNRVLDFLK